jgi:hypothetical protein
VTTSAIPLSKEWRTIPIRSAIVFTSLDTVDQILDIQLFRIEGYHCLLCGEVHIHLTDPRQLTDRALDVMGATGSTHARYRHCYGFGGHDIFLPFIL